MADSDKPSSFSDRVRQVVQATKDIASRTAEAAKKAVAQLDFFARFKEPETDQEIDFPIDMEGDTVWATQAQLAALFGVNVPAISKHISNIYEEGELTSEATISKLEVVRKEGTREVSRSIDHYNLDMILAVGYRVSGKRATEFRKWASRILKGYIQDGYALNGKRLDSDPAALAKLAREVRAIRTSEKNLYQQVRETFAACAIDYDPASEEARRFFAQCQDKFHYAVSEQTAVQIILKRADGTKPNMGMTSLGNRAPTLADAKIAKNYLTEEELRSMEILGEQWLLYAESMAMRKKAVSMKRLLNKIDELVGVHEYTIFPGYAQIGKSRAQADQHAKRQLDLYKRRLLAAQ